MSIVFVHLRWDDVSSVQFEEVCRAIPPGDSLPEGCCSHQLRLVGRVLLGCAVWTDMEGADRYLARLPGTLRAADLGTPHVAAFSMPFPYGLGYTGPRVYRASCQPTATSVPVPVGAPVTLAVSLPRTVGMPATGPVPAAVPALAGVRAEPVRS
jgi:hypothetical protein